jgi:hypothetical protein
MAFTRHYMGVGNFDLQLTESSSHPLDTAVYNSDLNEAGCNLPFGKDFNLMYLLLFLAFLYLIYVALRAYNRRRARRNEARALPAPGEPGEPGPQ